MPNISPGKGSVTGSKDIHHGQAWFTSVKWGTTISVCLPGRSTRTWLSVRVFWHATLKFCQNFVQGGRCCSKSFIGTGGSLSFSLSLFRGKAQCDLGAAAKECQEERCGCSRSVHDILTSFGLMIRSEVTNADSLCVLRC